MHKAIGRLLPYILCLLLPVGLGAQTLDAPPKDAPPTPTDAKPADTTKPAKPAPKPGDLKAYKDVITADAKSETGLFTVHHVGEKYYFEIPASVLNKDMLWKTEVEQLSGGFGGTPANGTPSNAGRVIRWTRHENKIFLRAVDYSVRGDGKDSAIQRAVDAATVQPIILAFDIETEGKDKSAVIDVSRFLLSDQQEFSARQALGGGGLDTSRSYVEKVKPFPTNLEMKVMLTYSVAPSPFFFRRTASAITALVHYSMVELPDTPMQGRYADSRLGFFTEDFDDYGRTDNRVVEQRYITRYRLEKKDPSAKISEPIKPLVYYLSREVPEKWRPYLKKGVEAWNEAFEGAGFKNAIQCKDAPTVQEDPNWDPEDARYSVIRWAPTPTENAEGPNIHDPRSGEIISAHIIVWHNVLKIAEDWYFVQCAAQDSRAQRLPLPELLMGEILQYIVCHEVGHTLGLEHNFKGSSAYTCAQLRDPKFTAEYGDEASIMDYGRFNYVAQPGDGARLIPKIGPYDKFAIAWGYTPIPSAKTPDAEKAELDRMAAAQVENPMLRFGNSRFEDPTVRTEDLGSDPIEATQYGLKNLARVAQLLIPATTKYGEDYKMLEEMYDMMLNQRSTELAQVVALVGGVVETDYHAGHGGEVFRPVPRAKQAQAVKFLLDNAFTTPRDLLIPDILYRIEPSGVADRVLNNQTFTLFFLFQESRIKRLVDAQLLMPDDAYTVAQLVTTLTNGVFSELRQPHPTIDLYRRNLQRNYLQILNQKLVGNFASESEFRPVALGALRDLAKTIDLALPKVTDRATELHLRDCRTTIERTLNPKHD